jgi:hypothetical protein
MSQLKPITTEGIARALQKAERYRLLNEPAEAESICRDIISVDPGNQKALIMLILTLTDQFAKGTTEREALSLLDELEDNYQRAYYKGIIHERSAKAVLERAGQGNHHDAYEWLHEAMDAFAHAERIRPAGNDDPILRWNACIRTIRRYRLSARIEEHPQTVLE